MLNAFIFTLRNGRPSHVELRDDRPGVSIDTQTGIFALHDIIEFMRSLNELVKAETMSSDIPGITLVYEEIRIMLFPTLRHEGFIAAMHVKNNDYMETTFLSNDKAVELVLLVERFAGTTYWKAA